MEDRQDIVVDQDLKNGLSSTLEFCAEAHRLAGNEKGRQYLLDVSRDITSGRGHPAPNPGPVTPLGRTITMDEDHVKTVISTVVTAATVLVPGVGEAINAVGGPAEVTGIVIGVWGLAHGLINYVHGLSK